MTVHLAALSKTNTLRTVFITCWARFKIPRAGGRLCPQPHLEPLPPEMPPKAPRSARVRVAASTGALTRSCQTSPAPPEGFGKESSVVLCMGTGRYSPQQYLTACIGLEARVGRAFVEMEGRSIKQALHGSSLEDNNNNR